jgi:hypothetical protein
VQNDDGHACVELGSVSCGIAIVESCRRHLVQRF